MKTLKERIEELENKIASSKMSASEFRKAMSSYHALGLKLEAQEASQKKKIVNGCNDVAYRFMK